MIDRAVGGMGGRGHQSIGRLREIRGVKIASQSRDIEGRPAAT
jgi:hypothetical protein